jgi:hypothetical protein
MTKLQFQTEKQETIYIILTRISIYELTLVLPLGAVLAANLVVPGHELKCGELVQTRLD